MSLGWPSTILLHGDQLDSDPIFMELSYLYLNHL